MTSGKPLFGINVAFLISFLLSCFPWHCTGHKMKYIISPLQTRGDGPFAWKNPSCHPGAGQIIDLRIKLRVFWVVLQLLRTVARPLSRNTLALLFALLLIPECGLQTTRERCQIPRGDGGVIVAFTGL